jgi:hypothetical protein
MFIDCDVDRNVNTTSRFERGLSLQTSKESKLSFEIISSERVGAKELEWFIMDALPQLLLEDITFGADTDDMEDSS